MKVYTLLINDEGQEVWLRDSAPVDSPIKPKAIHDPKILKKVLGVPPNSTIEEFEIESTPNVNFVKIKYIAGNFIFEDRLNVSRVSRSYRNL